MTNWIEAWRAYRRRRQAVRELEGYDAAQLRDLGITRDQIGAYVDGTLPSRSAAVVLPFPSRAALGRCCPPPCCAAA